MGEPGRHEPVLLLIGAFSRAGEALDWSRAEIQVRWGGIALESERFAFTETDYYAASMGDGLLKQFFVVRRLVSPARLASIKLATNRMERDYARQHDLGVPRPLNLDPGYLSLAKLVLASTKDHGHRLYVGRGIYAEVTLRWQGGAWRASPWTYPDYRRPDYQEFFRRARQMYKELRAES